MADTSSGSAGPGWYPDPSGAAPARWWDGARWTELISSERPAAPPPSGAPAAVPAPPAEPAGDAEPGPRGASPAGGRPAVEAAAAHALESPDVAPPAGDPPGAASNGPIARADAVSTAASPGNGAERAGRSPLWAKVALGLAGLVLLVVGGCMALGDDDAREAPTTTARGSSAGPGTTRTPPLPSTAPTAATTTVPIAPPDDGPDLGSRENMAAPGQRVRLFDTAEGNVDVTVQQFIPDATDVVAAEDPLHDPAPPGTRFALVTVAVTYHAGQEKQTGSFFAHLDAALIGASGQPISDTGCGVEVPQELDQFAELGNGGTVAGNLCFVLPDAESTGGLALRVEEAFCFSSCDAAWFRLR